MYSWFQFPNMSVTPNWSFTFRSSSWNFLCTSHLSYVLSVSHLRDLWFGDPNYICQRVQYMNYHSQQLSAVSIFCIHLPFWVQIFCSETPWIHPYGVEPNFINLKSKYKTIILYEVLLGTPGAITISEAARVHDVLEDQDCCYFEGILRITMQSKINGTSH